MEIQGHPPADLMRPIFGETFEVQGPGAIEAKEMTPGEYWDYSLRVFNSIECPFEYELNISADEVQEILDQWVVERLLVTKEKIEKFHSFLFATLTGAIHHCEKDLLVVPSYWATWLFNYDDVQEERRDLGKLKNFNETCLEILRLPLETRLTIQGEPLLLAFNDCSEKAKILAIKQLEEGKLNEQWMKRFLVNVEEHFDSIVWETEKKGIPDLKTYLEMRLLTGAVNIMFDLIELTAGLNVPDEVIKSAYFQDLRNSINNVVCGDNDIISGPKGEDCNNLVEVYMNEYQYSRKEGLDRAKRFVEEERTKVLKLLKETLDFGIHQEVAEKYRKELCFWISSNKKWSTLTARYKNPHVSIPLDAIKG